MGLEERKTANTIYRSCSLHTFEAPPPEQNEIWSNVDTEWAPSWVAQQDQKQGDDASLVEVDHSS